MLPVSVTLSWQFKRRDQKELLSGCCIQNPSSMGVVYPIEVPIGWVLDTGLALGSASSWGLGFCCHSNIPALNHLISQVWL